MRLSEIERDQELLQDFLIKRRSGETVWPFMCGKIVKWKSV